MGMTIDESLENLKTLQADYQQFYDDVWQDPESLGIMAESLQVAIDTMSKYQKIQEIIAMDDENHRRTIRLADLKEVLEDGQNTIKD